jgi:hypothetical protein
MVTRAAFIALAVCSLASGEGGLAGAFLNYGLSPRSLGMGKAFCAVADDAQAGYFNPGGLFQLNAQEVILAHSQLYGARMEYVGYALPTRELGTFSVTLVNFGAEGIDARTYRNDLQEDYAFAENAFAVSYAFSPWSVFGVGANLKMVTKNLAQYSGVGVGADLGMLLRAPGPLSFGLAVQNVLQPSVVLARVPDVYPRMVRLGGAVRLLDGRATIAADVATPVVFDSDSAGWPTRKFTPQLEPHGGVEIDLVPGVLIPRVGIDMNEVSVGLGVHRSWGKMGMGVDYAFLLHHRSNYRLSPTHKVGFMMTFSGFRVWIDAQPAVFSPTPEDKQNVLWMDVRLMTRAPVKRWQVLVKNSFGEVVRSYSGWEQPPLRMTWDGLDDAGRLVSDGRYSYEIIVVDKRNTSLEYSGTLTQVRTRGPQGKIEIRPGQD